MLKPEEFLDKLHSGELGDELPLRRYLVGDGIGKYTWYDEFVHITSDVDGEPLEYPYAIGTIFIKGRKPAIRIFFDVSNWYDFDAIFDKQPETSNTSKNMISSTIPDEMRLYC